MIELCEKDFEATVTAAGVSLVHCWAPHCGTCKEVGPRFERVAARHTQHTFAKLDTVSESGLAQELEILHTPTLLVYRDGLLLFKQAGGFDEDALEDIVRQVEGLDMDLVRADLESKD